MRPGAAWARWPTAHSGSPRPRGSRYAQTPPRTLCGPPAPVLVLQLWAANEVPPEGLAATMQAVAAEAWADPSYGACLRCSLALGWGTSAVGPVAAAYVRSVTPAALASMDAELGASRHPPALCLEPHLDLLWQLPWKRSSMAGLPSSRGVLRAWYAPARQTPPPWPHVPLCVAGAV